MRHQAVVAPIPRSWLLLQNLHASLGSAGGRCIRRVLAQVFQRRARCRSAVEREVTLRQAIRPSRMLLVAGGGPAGMAVATAAAEAGATCVFSSRRSTRLGGHLRWGGPDGLDLPCHEWRCPCTSERSPTWKCSPTPSSAGRYDHNWIGVLQAAQHSVMSKERLIKAQGRDSRDHSPA